MLTITLDGITLTQTIAAELLALAPDVPADMTADDALAAIHAVLIAHRCDLAECIGDLMQEYGDHLAETARRMARCTIVAARVVGTVV